MLSSLVVVAHLSLTSSITSTVCTASSFLVIEEHPPTLTSTTSSLVSSLVVIAAIPLFLISSSPTISSTVFSIVATLINVVIAVAISASISTSASNIVGIIEPEVSISASISTSASNIIGIVLPRVTVDAALDTQSVATLFDDKDDDGDSEDEGTLSEITLFLQTSVIRFSSLLSCCCPPSPGELIPIVDVKAPSLILDTIIC